MHLVKIVLVIKLVDASVFVHSHGGLKVVNDVSKSHCVCSTQTFGPSDPQKITCRLLRRGRKAKVKRLRPPEPTRSAKKISKRKDQVGAQSTGNKHTPPKFSSSDANTPTEKLTIPAHEVSTSFSDDSLPVKRTPKKKVVSYC
ncbi:hypothetical protein DSO57_1007781 [Entomophthora muscae]|uniref:Uncharacterized protein n=1 Tax=Entomophthora muscae TaxID=34485 RepID=A0ACC2RM19_9FUNG|nr:hypothetical protein DSO57_1007781 [Entomophthora muscae]